MLVLEVSKPTDPVMLLNKVPKELLLKELLKMYLLEKIKSKKLLNQPNKRRNLSITKKKRNQNIISYVMLKLLQDLDLIQLKPTKN
jgi:hypothetical protein